MVTVIYLFLFIYLFIYLFGANKRKNILQMILFECMDHETIWEKYVNKVFIELTNNVELAPPNSPS